MICDSSADEMSFNKPRNSSSEVLGSLRFLYLQISLGVDTATIKKNFAEMAYPVLNNLMPASVHCADL
jgi:hypothetical protein